MRHGAYRQKYPWKFARKKIGKSYDKPVDLRVSNAENSAVTVTGWWYTYPSEKHESQLERIIPYIMENNQCWNHQPAVIVDFKFWSTVPSKQVAAEKKQICIMLYLYIQYIHERPAIASHEP